MIISTALLLGSLTTSFELLHRSPRLVANVTNQSKLRFNIMRKQYLASSFGGREEGGEEEEEEPLRILPPIPTTKDTLKVNKKNIAPFIRIELREEDLEETFSRSSGSGGQHVNKTNSRVQLTHVPTQITVTCQEQRDLHMNRKIARKKLKDQLDLLYNGDKSKISKKIDKIQKRKSKAKRYARNSI